MIDKIILGLLTKRDLTSYAIKVAMDKSISQFYSNSLGSINPAIKKLEKKQWVTCSESIENNRLKKIYKITQKGIIAYNHWISEPIKQGRLRDEVLIRIFFLGDSDKEKRIKLITDYLEELDNSKKNLEQIKETVGEEGLSIEKRNAINFQLSTLQFGIDYFSFKQEWFLKLLKTL